MTGTYQSWTNKATWSVNNFFSYGPEYDHWAQELENMADVAREDVGAAIEELADMMYRRMADGLPEVDAVWYELMQYALTDAIDFDQIAHSFVISRFGDGGAE